MKDKEDSQSGRYACLSFSEEQLQAGDAAFWEQIPPVHLVDTVTGEAVLEPTWVRLCWTREALYVQFRCADHFIKAEFAERDDPLYEQDVVELFLDLDGGGREYLEIELSPNNLVFDARIRNDGPGTPLTIDKDWDLRGLRTAVSFVSERVCLYELRLPLAELSPPPVPGTKWRVNFYRIDENPDGAREYQAWQPTGAVNFHIPACFGTLVFL